MSASASLRSFRWNNPGPSTHPPSSHIPARREELEALLAGTKEEPVLLHPNMAAHYRRQVARTDAEPAGQAGNRPLRRSCRKSSALPERKTGRSIKATRPFSRLRWLRGPATSFTERELNGGVVSNGRSYSQWFELRCRAGLGK